MPERETARLFLSENAGKENGQIPMSEKIIHLKNCSVPTQEPNNAKERNNAITFKYIISVSSLNILYLFLLVIIYPIVLNLNTCININNEYNTRIV